VNQEPSRAAVTPLVRRRLLPRLIAAVLLTAAISVIYVAKIERRMPDYDVYKRAAERALIGAPLYRPDDGHYQFKYLPAFAVATVPLALAPPRATRAAWFAGSVLLLVLLLRTCALVLPERLHPRGYLIGITFVLLGKFFVHELELGQVNILFATLIVVAVRQMRIGRELAAGLLVAAAIVVKPYAVLLVPYLAARRKPASLAGVGLGLGTALLLPATLYGFAGNARLLGEWWRTVTETTAPNLADYNNVSAASVFARWLGPGPTAEALAAALVLALLAVAGIVFLKRTGIAEPEPLEVGLLLTLIPLISPQGWDYVFLLSALATMMLVNYKEALPPVIKPAVLTALVVVAFSIFDVIGRAAYVRFMRLSLITVCYLVIIAGVAALRWRKVA
jgi:glycosyl transferase family 87